MNFLYIRNNKINVLKIDIMVKDLIDMFFKRIQLIWLWVEIVIIKYIFVVLKSFFIVFIKNNFIIVLIFFSCLEILINYWVL